MTKIWMAYQMTKITALLMLMPIRQMQMVMELVMLVITVQPALMLTKQTQMVMCMEMPVMHIQIHLILQICFVPGKSSMYAELMEITTVIHALQSKIMFKSIISVLVETAKYIVIMFILDILVI